MKKQLILAFSLLMMSLACLGQENSLSATRNSIQSYLEALGNAGFSGTVLVAAGDSLLADQAYTRPSI